MRKLLFILVSLIMLVACSGADSEYKKQLKEAEKKLEETKKDTERLEKISNQIDETTELLEDYQNEIGVAESTDDEIETLFKKDMNLVLFENEDIKIDLLLVAHGRVDSTDYVALKTKIENKQNKTFEFFIKDLKVDGKEIDDIHSWMGEGEVKPNETIEVFINGYEYEELSIEEHVAGMIILRDYEGNRSELKFSEYINE